MATTPDSTTDSAPDSTPEPTAVSASHSAARDVARVSDDEFLLRVRGLRTHFYTDQGVVPAVDGVSFDIFKGKTLGVVGESGCGKSVTAMSIMKLIPQPPGRIVSGSMHFEGRDLVRVPLSEMRRIRGNRIGMIFQEPMTSLNPVYTVGNQIAESIHLHLKLGKREGRELAIDMLNKVGIPDPTQRIDNYPHQMSGGMKQRVMIAMGLVCKPALLIADEPTTALDVTIQAQILELLDSLQREYNMGVMLITHDLGVVAEVSDNVLVMYAGKVAEYGDVYTIFESPRHPYTLGLFRSLPKLDVKEHRLETIPGMVPSPLNFPSGCHFRDRCKFATVECALSEPLLEEVSLGHTVACHHWRGVEAGTKANTGPYLKSPEAAA